MPNVILVKCEYCDQAIPSKDGFYQEHYNRNGIWKCPMSGESSENAQTEDVPTE